MRRASEVASRTRYGCSEILASQALAALDVEDTQIRVEEGNGPAIACPRRVGKAVSKAHQGKARELRKKRNNK